MSAVKNYSCYIHGPKRATPALVAVTCEGAERAMIHAERAADALPDWWVIEVYEGPRRVAYRSREAA